MTNDRRSDDFDDFTDSHEARALRKAAVEERRRMAIANLGRDTPIREDFHTYLMTMGYHPRVKASPEPGRSYPSYHIEQLWRCYLHATLTERARR
ncbi:MAG: hypothetical protein IPG23_00305 [Burkholderiales bacterium]|nr:hypothetical protein [Burkholderiales bacterium]